MDESNALALRDKGGALTAEGLHALPTNAQDRIAQLVVRADEYRWYSSLAEKMARGNMLPKGMNAQGAAICMLEGQSLGFTELQSLKHLTAINNTVGLMNVGAMAILRTNKALKKGTTVEKEWFYEPALDGEEALDEGRFSRLLTYQDSQNPDVAKHSDEVFNSMGCRVTLHKKGHIKAFTDSFTIGDAKRMGKWGEKGVWAAHPMRMLFNRAWGRLLTDHFSEYTSGLRLESELRDDVVIDLDPADAIGGVAVQVTVPDDDDPLADMVAESPESASEETAAADVEAPENPDSVEQASWGGTHEGRLDPDVSFGDTAAMIDAEVGSEGELVGQVSGQKLSSFSDYQGERCEAITGCVYQKGHEGGCNTSAVVDVYETPSAHEVEEPDPIESVVDTHQAVADEIYGAAIVSAEEILGDQSRDGKGDHRDAESLPFAEGGPITATDVMASLGEKRAVPPHSLGEDDPHDPGPVPTVAVACPYCSEPNDYPLGQISTCWNAGCMQELQIDDEGNLVEST